MKENKNETNANYSNILYEPKDNNNNYDIIINPRDLVKQVQSFPVLTVKDLS